MAEAAMAGQAARALPKVGSRKEFMDTLHDMNHQTGGRGPGRDSRGRAPRLRTYVLERNGPLGPGRGEKASWDVGDTGVDEIKILTVMPGRGGAPRQFYIDMADGRFILLHTDGPAEGADADMEMLVEDGSHKLDHVWFHSGLMERWAREPNWEFGGYAINHGGLLREESTTLRMEVSGTEAGRLRRSIAGLRDSGGMMSHEAIKVSRGSKRARDGYVEERISNRGCFTIKRGRSIQDHLHIVEDCKDEYACMVASAEECRMGKVLQDGSWTYGGRPMEITYPRVKKLGRFVGALFRATQPFRLWGIGIKRDRDYYSVPAIDLHEGSPIDFEITPTFMRVYTRRESCGNTMLRLLANLQAQYSASARCEGLER